MMQNNYLRAVLLLISFLGLGFNNVFAGDACVDKYQFNAINNLNAGVLLCPQGVITVTIPVNAKLPDQPFGIDTYGKDITLKYSSKTPNVILGNQTDGSLHVEYNEAQFNLVNFPKIDVGPDGAVLLIENLGSSNVCIGRPC